MQISGVRYERKKITLKKSARFILFYTKQRNREGIPLPFAFARQVFFFKWGKYGD